MFLINRLVPYMRFLICIVSFIETEEPAGSIEVLDDIQEDGNPRLGVALGLSHSLYCRDDYWWRGNLRVVELAR